MSQSSFGNKFKVTTWGESHGKALGAVIDGCPAGLPLCEEDIQKFLDRRKPGQSRYATARKEGDLVEILSEIQISAPETTEISHTPIVPDMQIILLTKNTDSATTEAADVLQGGKPSEELQQVPLLLKY